MIDRIELKKYRTTHSRRFLKANGDIVIELYVDPFNKKNNKLRDSQEEPILYDTYI